ncbi:MAG: 30S ribosomal protein S20, partial [Chloroflexi bacterium]|nr:30S ribosomal protein S20 [Chloroflexota bacterium]
TAKKSLLNRYYGKTTRNLIRDIREETDKKKAEGLLPKVVSNVDKLAKKNIIHKNKAAKASRRKNR